MYCAWLRVRLYLSTKEAEVRNLMLLFKGYMYLFISGPNDYHMKCLLQRGCPQLQRVDLSLAGRGLTERTVEAIGNSS